jgi:hypothetical protein
LIQPSRSGWILAPLVVGAGLTQTAAPPAYHPAQLDCAAYRQTLSSDIRLEGARERSRETSGRDGVIHLRATPRDTLIALEAWFDTLEVWREGHGERLAPETDGVIGGRFTGLLTRQGGLTVTDRPFIPDEVAQVAEINGALEDLLPPLPRVALTPGTGWKDGFGTVITRLADGRHAGRGVERYRLIRRTSRSELRLLPDSSEVRATRVEDESGTIFWSVELGLVRWERSITVDVGVPRGGVVQSPFRTRIVQQVTVERVGGRCG